MTLRPLIAYVPWLARDLAVRALAPLFVLLILGGLPLYAMLSTQEVVDLANNTQQADAVRQMLWSIAPLAIALAGFLISTQGVALDRDRQHVRFLFSHQVAPWTYYLGRFLLGIVVFNAVFAIAPLIVEIALLDIRVLGTLAALTLQLILVGSLGVLCASLTHKDGLALVLSYFVIRTLQQLSASDVLADWADPIVKGLPPFETLNGLVRALMMGTDFQWTQVIHVAGYGIGLLIAGLLVIRRAPLVR
jgi:hypothetical protein